MVAELVAAQGNLQHLATTASNYCNQPRCMMTADGLNSAGNLISDVSEAIDRLRI